MNTLRIAKLTFREALRRKALYGALALTVAFLGLYAWGTAVAIEEINRLYAPGGLARIVRQAGVDLRPIAIGELLLAGLFAVSNIAGLLAIFTAAGTIAQEIEQGTLHSIVPKPVARWQIVVGKWLGGSAMVAAYLVLTSLATVAIVYQRSGYLPAQLPAGLLLFALRAVLLFTVTLVGSALAPAVATGIAMFIVYVAANVAGMVEQIGVALNIETMVRIGVIASLVLPSDALWKMGAFAVQPPNPLPALGLKITLGPFGVVDPPSIWMGAYAVAYLLLALGAAIAIFSRRDL
jgi:ABC-type transport system involved in multi-copper enzyme maturation permease subunit